MHWFYAANGCVSFALLTEALARMFPFIPTWLILVLLLISVTLTVLTSPKGQAYLLRCRFGLTRIEWEDREPCRVLYFERPGMRYYFSLKRPWLWAVEVPIIQVTLRSGSPRMNVTLSTEPPPKAPFLRKIASKISKAFDNKP